MQQTAIVDGGIGAVIACIIVACAIAVSDKKETK
jgi:hypothetical protein